MSSTAKSNCAKNKTMSGSRNAFLFYVLFQEDKKVISQNRYQVSIRNSPSLESKLHLHRKTARKP